MADDLKDARQLYQQDVDDWADARAARAKDMRALAGDPWDPEERRIREDAGRPCLTFDELTQHTNQVVNEFRSNPLSVEFAPGPPLTAGPQVIQATEDAAQLYADAMREMEYRCNAPEVYATAAENAVCGGYGFVRLVSEYVPKSLDQRLALKAVPDPNTVIPNWDFQAPDLSDMRRCWVLEKRPLRDFQQMFPKASIQSFDGYLKDAEYTNWLSDGHILLAEQWEVRQVPAKLLRVQLPPVQPPRGVYDFRPPVAPPPIDIYERDFAKLPTGATVLASRDDYEPKVVKRIINGVEILEETTWPGPYIPIAGCMGRILYLDDGGTSKRLMLSSIRLALEPFMAYNFYRTSEIETVGMITKNPYWAYAGQVTPDQQREIAKSMHEPVAVLFAEPTTERTGQQVLPLPIRNPQSADLGAFSIGAEESRRAILSALGEAALPTSAQRQNEKSKVALDKIEQSRQKGTYHFFDHYKGMIRHIGRLFEAAFDTFHDTARDIPVRRRDEKVEKVRINDPSVKGAIDVRGSYTVIASAGPHVDSTREAASDFADMLLESQPLMELLGPQKASQIAALAVKLKVKQTGIGAIGDQIVDIISPPPGKAMSPEQMQAALQQADQLLRMAQQHIAKLEDEQRGKLALEQQKGAVTLEKARMDNEVKLAVAELGAKVERMALFLEERARVGTQQHDLALAAADAGHEERMADTQTLVDMAQPQDDNAPAA